jgi:hypothetical protein
VYRLVAHPLEDNALRLFLASSNENGVFILLYDDLLFDWRFESIDMAE